jgi:DNA-binding GntR family transcriptional regulator
MERLLVEIGSYIEQNDMDKIVEADSQFHDILYRASRNERLVGIINNLREQLTRFRSLSMSYPGRLKAMFAEHTRMVESLGQRNVSLAQQFAGEHMANAEQVLLKNMLERGSNADKE